MAERKQPESEPRRDAEGRPIAGNAQRDPDEQTCREDMPPGEEQERCGEPGRGSDSPDGQRPRLRLDEEKAVRGKGKEDAAQDVERRQQ